MERLDPYKIESYQKMRFTKETKRQIVDFYSQGTGQDFWVSGFEYSPCFGTLEAELPKDGCLRISRGSFVRAVNTSFEPFEKNVIIIQTNPWRIHKDHSLTCNCRRMSKI